MPQKKLSRAIRIVAILTVVLVAAFFVWWFLIRQPPIPNNIIALSGRIEGDDSVVASKTSGRIREIHVREGDGVKADVFVPEVANHVPHVRISWNTARMTPADVVKAMRDGEPSIGTRSEGDTIVIGVWMMRPGEEKIVARRLRQVLEKKG